MKGIRFAACLMAAVVSTVSLAGCAKKYDADAVVASTADGSIEITAGLVNFMAQITAVSYDSYLASYYGTDMWDTDLSGSGSTLAETVRESTLEEVELDYLLEAHMEDYDVTISDEEEENIATYTAEFIEENSEEALEQLGATEEYVSEMMRLTLIANKMEEAIKAEADTEVSDDEAAQRTFSYYTVTLDTDDSEEETTEDSTESVEESTEEQAAELLALAESVATYAATDFDGVADTYGYTVSTYSYGSDEDSFDANAIEAADALSEGEVSGAIASEDGETYYIIRLDSEYDEEATEEKKEEIIEERQEELYTEVTDGWTEDADWQEDDSVLATISFDNMYTIVDDEDTEATETTVESTETAASTEVVESTETAESTETSESTEEVESTESVE